MTRGERLFFRLVCEECYEHRQITEAWVKMYADSSGWTYELLLEWLCKWSFDGVYTYTGKIANGRIEFGKLYGEYKMIANQVMR